MSKKGKDFKAGDFIFAKVKGYPAWPARIRGKNGKKFFVYFYGTGETANLMANVLYDYKDNKDKFLAKPMKRRDFNDGLLQINYEIENNVPLPAGGEDTGEPAGQRAEGGADDSGVADSTMEVDATLNETGGDDSQTNDSTVNDSKLDESVDQDDSDEANPPLVIDEEKKTRKSKAPVTPRTESKRKTVTPASSKPAEEATTTPTPGRGRPRAKRTAEESPVVAIPAKKRRHVEPEKCTEEPAVAAPEQATTAQDADETEKEPPTEDVEGETEVGAEGGDSSHVAEVPSEVEAEVATPKTKKGGRTKTLYHNVSVDDLTDLKEPFKEVVAEDGRPKQSLLLARLPNQRYVGIKLFQDRPKTFNTPAAKLSWESQMARNAIDLRHKLESGLIKASHIPNELVTELGLTDEEKQNIEKEKEIEDKRYRLNFLRAEMKLGELATKIKCNLGLQKADTQGCLALMEELLTLEMKPLMLYKNHKIVETIKRLRSYVGDTTNWSMSEEELQQFSADASLIRKKAEECYQSFKLLFPEPEEGVTFFQQFSQKHGLFHACTKSLSEDDMLELVHEPPEMLDPSNPIQPILQAMDEADDDELPKKRRKTTNTNTTAEQNPTPANKIAKSRPRKSLIQKDVDTSKDTDKLSSETTHGGKDGEKKVSEKEKDKQEAGGGSAPAQVEPGSGTADAEKDKSDQDSAKTLDSSTDSTDKSNDKASSNKSDKQEKVARGGGDSGRDKERDRHSRSSDKVTEKSVKSRSDDSSKHSSSKHSKSSSEKDKVTSKSSEKDKGEKSDRSGSRSDKAKSDRKSVQDKLDKEEAAPKRKGDDDDNTATSNSSKDSDKTDERGDRKRERDRSSSGLNGTEKDGETDKTSASNKADKIRKSSSSSSHQSDSGKYSSKKRSTK